MSFLSCVLVADQFWNAFEMLNENEHRVRAEIDAGFSSTAPTGAFLDKIDNREFKSTGIAAIVNISFATELYLKAYHVATGTGWQRGHDTKRLFDTLSPAARDALFEVLFNNEIGNTKSNVLDRLAHNSDAFEKFRYFHEIPEASYMIGFAKNLVTSLRLLIEPFAKAEVMSLRAATLEIDSSSD